MKNPNTKSLTIAGIVIAILFVCTIGYCAFSWLTNYVATGLTKDNNSGAALYDCTMTSSTTIQSDEAYFGDLFVGKTDSNKSWDEKTKTSSRSFSVKDYENKAASLTEDIFFKVSRFDNGFFPQKTSEISLQLCDSNNKTANANFIYTESSNTTALTLYVHGGRLPIKTGKYRVDGVLRVNGVVKLISRIDSVEFTQ